MRYHSIIYHSIKRQLRRSYFGKNNIKIINKRVINEYKILSLLVYSDASNSGLASIYNEKGKKIFLMKVFQIKTNLKVPRGVN